MQHVLIPPCQVWPLCIMHRVPFDICVRRVKPFYTRALHCKTSLLIWHLKFHLWFFTFLKLQSTGRLKLKDLNTSMNMYSGSPLCCLNSTAVNDETTWWWWIGVWNLNVPLAAECLWQRQQWLNITGYTPLIYHVLKNTQPPASHICTKKHTATYKQIDTQTKISK